MANNNALRERGIELIRAAQAHEERQEWADALRDYENGIEQLITAVKYERNEPAKQVMNGRIRTYLERAEEL